MSILLIIIGFLVIVIIGFLALVYIPSPKFKPIIYQPISPDYFPTEGFRVTTPEAQGMDSEMLLNMLDDYQEQHIKDTTISIDSISIIRHGYLVADIYLNPMFPPDTSHVIHSCAKSIMSALIGIAIDKGYIDSVDVPIMSFFADKDITITDQRMKAITLQNLLTMRTGMRSQDAFLYEWRGLFDAMKTDDWVAHTLSLKMDTEAGTRFDYSNLSSFLLSAIIEKSTGMDTLSFARQNLFDPLGIKEVYWERSPQGIYIGFARMWLKPHDMAKFGLLYLQKGHWDDQQIIPTAWIEESIAPYSYPRNYSDILDEDGKKDGKASQRNWISSKFFRPFGDGYGYQWWLDKNGSYTALGTSGQYIMVIPEQDLVVVVTNASSRLGNFFPAKLLKRYIVPACKSDHALETNDSAYRDLAKRSLPPQLKLEPKPVPELPAMVLRISGETYTLEENRWNYDKFRLVFDSGLDYAEFSYRAKVHDIACFKVGLDGVYRYSDTPIGSFAAMGRWIKPDMFEINYQQIGYSAPTHFVLTFGGDTLSVTEMSLTGSVTYSGKVL